MTHAADLFAERGPAATSLRDIAARSGVNQGLIFRHIGNKDAVVAAVLQYLADEVAAAVSQGMPRDRLERVGERQWKVLARAVLDGYDVGELQGRFPVIEMLLQREQAGSGDDLQARLAVADRVALQLGWKLFGSFLRAAAGLQDVPEAELRAAVDARIAGVTSQTERPTSGH